MIARVHARALPAVAAALVVLVGCGGSGGAEPPTAPPSSGPPPRQTVQIRNYTYSPQNITVPAGTTVTWVQDDRTIHTVTDGGVFDSGALSRGQRYSHTFRTPGTYDYHCAVHTAMTGSVTVQ